MGIVYNTNQSQDSPFSIRYIRGTWDHRLVSQVQGRLGVYFCEAKNPTGQTARAGIDVPMWLTLRCECQILDVAAH